jgi:hypothetical protein
MLWLSETAFDLGTLLVNFAIGVWIFGQTGSARDYSLSIIAATGSSMLVTPFCRRVRRPLRSAAGRTHLRPRGDRRDNDCRHFVRGGPASRRGSVPLRCDRRCDRHAAPAGDPRRDQRLHRS